MSSVVSLEQDQHHTHLNDVVRRVNVNPIELRRHSINRASGHTFEYVGFGPGNYSTALPDRHDRSISAEEELLSHSQPNVRVELTSILV